MADSIIQHFFDVVTSTLEASINTTAQAVIGVITPTASVLLVIYICFWGWSMMRGAIEEPIGDGTARILRLITVYVIALSLGWYAIFLSNWLWKSGDAMAKVIAGGFGGKTTDTASAITYIDATFQKFYEYGGLLFDYSLNHTNAIGIPDIPYLLLAFLIFFVGVVLAFYAAYLLILSKMGLAILLGVGPMFVLATMFESTRRFFDGWISQVLNFIFIVILSAAILAVVGVELSKQLAIGIKDAVGDKPIPAINVFGIAGLGILVLLFLFQVTSIASGLAGGVSLQVARLPFVSRAKELMLRTAAIAGNKIGGATIGAATYGTRNAREARTTAARLKDRERSAN
ncbi:MAG: type IV secretion system protein, partial [Oxalobacteraceae bacterium]